MSNKKTILIFIAVGALLFLNVSGADAAESMIIEWETGSAGPYLTAVPDSRGKWQLGYGSIYNYREGRDVQEGDMATPEEALQWMRTEKQEKELIIDQAVTVPINANQRTALIDFAYNEGSAAFLGSHLLTYLNAGMPLQTVADEFDKWIYADDVINQGLVNRRAAEKQLFLS